ncbi:uncharacterized protein IWZ02DRAFT_124412 [Phyllosticta citriasiana]|uniref:Secreted protein n=1 Tax=Phyllosticta citriasiana TaxID=595635 RepID=A0ABR1KWS1_9PEZI
MVSKLIPVCCFSSLIAIWQGNSCLGELANTEGSCLRRCCTICNCPIVGTVRFPETRWRCDQREKNQIRGKNYPIKSARSKHDQRCTLYRGSPLPSHEC